MMNYNFSTIVLVSAAKARLFRFALLAAGFCLLGAGFVNAQTTAETRLIAGDVDALPNVSFDSGGGTIYKTLVQPDGKIIAAGSFRTFNGAARRNIVRLNADYTLDATFGARLNGIITAAALQTDGKIIIGGTFNTVGGVNRTRIARLNADGSLDASFNPGGGADNIIYDIAVQDDGKIIIGGSFSRIDTVYSFCVARLTANGAPDAAFASPIPPPMPSPNPPYAIPSIVYAVGIQPGGKIILGGLIALSYSGTTGNFKSVVRLNAGGSFDTAFNSGSINSNLNDLVIQPDGKIVIVGFFTTINQVRQNFVARLGTEGALDTTFNTGTGANFPVSTVALQADGKILIGGRFSMFNDVERQGLARLGANGALDDTFAPSGSGFANAVQTISALPNGTVLTGGAPLSAINFNSAALKLYNADGTNGTSIASTLASIGTVQAIAVQPDGKIVVGGIFARGSGLARINTDGTFDTNFPASSGFTSSSSRVKAIIIQPDGKIVVGGAGLIAGNIAGYDIIRLNADGSADAAFTPVDLPAAVNAMALQPDGRIVAVWGDSQPRLGFPIGGATRLNADGSTDASFASGSPNLPINDVVIQPDGKILIGFTGSFGYINSQTGSVNYNGLARLNADGTQDREFVPATSTNYETNRVTNVYALALQPDGKILVGGNLYKNGAATPTGVVRLNATGTLDAAFDAGAISSIADLARVEDIKVLPNGKLLVGGLFTNIGGAARVNAARLNADGAADVSFTADTDVYGFVRETAVQPSGKYLIGGEFETVNGVARLSLAGLAAETAPRRTAFDFDGDGRADVAVFRPATGTWFVQASQSGFAAVPFGQNGDRLAPADYDGDGKTDFAVFRSGRWFVQASQAGFIGVSFGQADDIAVPADYDGDGRADFAVFRPSTGVWYLLQSSAGFAAVSFGAANDVPTPGDYDGDGRADVGVFRAGVWYLLRSTAGFAAVQFGAAGDRAVAADYDGDGKTDVGVFRSGAWYALGSQAGFIGLQFGQAGDVAVPADYDGDGRADAAVFRAGAWYLQRTSGGFASVQFGQATDQPVPNAFVR